MLSKNKPPKLSEFELDSINAAYKYRGFSCLWCKSCLQRWPLQSHTHLTRVAGGWLDMIMCCWHQKKCWRARRATAGSKHVIYGRGNGLASAGATLPSISRTNLDARVWLWLPAIGWCITWIAVSTQQAKISRDWLSTFFKSRLLQLGSMQLAFCCVLYYSGGGRTV